MPEEPGYVWEEISVSVVGDVRTTVEHLRKCSCNGGWVEDPGWSAYEYGYTTKPREREPHDGLVPCGFCYHGGWDAPWPPVTTE